MKTLNFEEMEMVEGGFPDICGVVGAGLDAGWINNFEFWFLWYQTACQY
jgi:hypothetical protein